MPDDPDITVEFESTSADAVPKRTLGQKIRSSIREKVQQAKAQRQFAKDRRQFQKSPEGRKQALRESQQELKRLKTEAGIMRAKHQIAKTKRLKMQETLGSIGMGGTGAGSGGFPMGKGNVLNVTDFSGMDSMLGLGPTKQAKVSKTKPQDSQWKGFDNLFGV